tara:strand:- start:149 stop:889 length:741 start_codon:yes stop_codon:yes gene_type:complete
MRLLIILISFIHLTLNAEVRTWTSKTGTTIEADLVSINGGDVTLLKGPGKTITVNISQFSKADQAYIQSSAFREKAELENAKKGVVQLLTFSGDVRIISEKKTSVALNVGVVFAEGSTINTGDDGKAVLLFTSGTTVSVRENSELIVSLFQQEPTTGFQTGTVGSLKKEASKTKTRLKLNYGKLYSNIKKLHDESEFELHTSTGVAGIRGTEVILESNSEGSRFSVLNGSADFSDGKHPIQQVSHE